MTLFAGERSEQDGGPLVIEAATAEAADGWWAFRNDDGRTLKTLPTAAVRGIETVQSRRPWPGRINAHRPSGLVPAAAGTKPEGLWGTPVVGDVRVLHRVPSDAIDGAAAAGADSSA